MKAVAVAVVVAAAVPVAAVTAVAMAAEVVAVGRGHHVLGRRAGAHIGGPIIWRPDLRDVRRDLRRRAHVVGDALSRLGSPAWRARGAGSGCHWPSLAAADLRPVGHPGLCTERGAS